jgi:hypothetical protein
VGGIATPDLLSLLLGSAGPNATNQLRGYPQGAFGGTGFVLGNFELRFPLVAPTRGYSTWPVFLRRLHAALFMDSGETFDRPGQVAIAGHPLLLQELLFSAGAELRAEIVLGYSVRTDLRFGLARPLGALFGAGRSVTPYSMTKVAFYFTIGESF